jgi:hypothetical protein
MHPIFMHYFSIAGMNSAPTPGMKTAFLVIIAIAAIWSLIWKGFALWHSARNHQKVWYVALLIINSLGILEILYLLFFRKNKNDLVHTTTVTKVHTVTASTPAPDLSTTTTSATVE